MTGGNCPTTTTKYVTGVPLADTFVLIYSTIEPNTSTYYFRKNLLTSCSPHQEAGKQAGEAPGNSQEPWTPRVWDNFKKSERDLRKMNPAQKSRYLAYEDAPKAVMDAQESSRKRLQDAKKQERNQLGYNEEDAIEYEKNEKLIGQLKAAEARNRIRVMRMQYNANREHELNHLISCQSTARKAVRLQALVPKKPDQRNQSDSLDKISRGRVESLLEDTRGILTLRT